MSLRILLFSFLIPLTGVPASAQPVKKDTLNQPTIKGYHIGVVQPLLAIHQNKTSYMTEYDFYSIGFPFGLTLRTSGRFLIDLELVPFIKPYADDAGKPYDVHLLYHPGVLYPLGSGFTLGLRAAFESGQDQFGFTPLINKSFKIGPSGSFFVELVFPGRFGPEKSSGYTQVGGIHIGFGF
ncbi:MAG TPA: hypothetical protein PKM27_09455 [Saprospiraceae bacterium]|nr:hypothetical protein [Saprospiraceae bacterium]HNT21423.1 hypothetical protein [Saprospiraceae bacterium]